MRCIYMYRSASSETTNDMPLSELLTHYLNRNPSHCPIVGDLIIYNARYWNLRVGKKLEMKLVESGKFSENVKDLHVCIRTM